MHVRMYVLQSVKPCTLIRLIHGTATQLVACYTCTLCITCMVQYMLCVYYKEFNADI